MKFFMNFCGEHFVVDFCGYGRHNGGLTMRKKNMVKFYLIGFILFLGGCHHNQQDYYDYESPQKIGQHPYYASVTEAKGTKMTSAKEINEKLDEILKHQRDLRQVEYDYNDPEFELKDKDGNLVTKEEVLNKADEIYDGIITDLNKLTGDGERVSGMFTNIYYVNDMTQDRLIAEEIRLNKMEACLAKQDDPELN